MTHDWHITKAPSPNFIFTQKLHSQKRAEILKIWSGSLNGLIIPFYRASTCNACRARYCYGKYVRPSNAAVLCLRASDSPATYGALQKVLWLIDCLNEWTRRQTLWCSDKDIILVISSHTAITKFQGEPHHGLTHSLVDLPRWGLATADDHSDIFLLHCARSCDISFRVDWLRIHSAKGAITEGSVKYIVGRRIFAFIAFISETVRDIGPWLLWITNRKS